MKVMKGKTFHFRGESGEDLASLWNCKFHDTVSTTVPTSYSSLLRFVADVNKKWVANIHKALLLCPGGTFNKYEAVLPSPQAALILWGHRSYPFRKNQGVLFLHQIFLLIIFLAMLNELGRTTEGRISSNELGECV